MAESLSRLPAGGQCLISGTTFQRILGRLQASSCPVHPILVLKLSMGTRIRRCSTSNSQLRHQFCHLQCLLGRLWASGTSTPAVYTPNPIRGVHLYAWVQPQLVSRTRAALCTEAQIRITIYDVRQHICRAYIVCNDGNYSSCNRMNGNHVCSKHDASYMVGACVLR